VALFEQAAASAAPAHLAASVVGAGLAASGGAGLSGLSLVLFKLMNLTKIQIAAACVCLAAVPVAFEAHALRGARRDLAALSEKLTAHRQSLLDAQAQRDALSARLRVAEASTASLATSQQARPPAPQPAAPGWVDGSPFARVPKSLLERARFNALGSDWRLRPELAAVLALTPEELDGAQQAVDEFFAEIRALEEAHLERLPPAQDADADGESVSFRITRYEPEANAARLRLRERLRAGMGEARADLALKYLDFAPARRAALQPDEPMPDGDFFEEASHNSGRWNFHGYERTIAMTLPDDPERGPELTVNLKFGSGSMTFGGDHHLFNPAVAAPLKAQWEALRAARPAPLK
jgi:hypothetical protein